MDMMNILKNGNLKESQGQYERALKELKAIPDDQANI